MMVADTPKSLQFSEVRAARVAMLRNVHMLPLTALVEEIRRAERLPQEIPFFDPLDGGVEAKVLFVLEAPGPRALASGFVSRNNPDDTAKNMFQLLQEAGFERRETLLCNIVPWYIGTGKKIRPANRSDMLRGLAYLKALIGLLPRLQCIILLGRNTAAMRPKIAELSPVPIFETPHPSPLFVNNKPGNWNLLLASFRAIRCQVFSAS